MQREIWVIRFGILFIMTVLLSGCGGGSNNNDSSATTTMDTGSNIPYLRDNHANYSEHGSQQTPAPTKDANTKSINWTISATTEESAVKLQEHLAFMEKRLSSDQNPRPWDKLFLMEAYMKYNKYYTTHVERSATNVIVSKVANTVCAYDVIAAHADAVSGDFFARGDITIDNSFTAERILASAACDAERGVIESYITSRQRQRGN